MKEQIVEATIYALKLVRNVRFFRTERGFQGELFCGLKTVLCESGILKDDLILEMEYQKTQYRHYTKQRPDIILHIPTELSDSEVYKNNVAVWALKRNASIIDAQDDFSKIDKMFQMLNYKLGFFINIDSRLHHLKYYDGQYKDRIFAFGIQLSGKKLQINKASFE
ncbi:MAG: hypothetical protein ACFFDT_28400, partial [Candidatus Hodarchaeota archaeon]